MAEAQAKLGSLRKWVHAGKRRAGNTARLSRSVASYIIAEAEHSGVPAQPKKLTRRVLVALLLLMAFYMAVALLFVFHSEDPWSGDPLPANATGQRILDAVYFGTVLMSTVGYGDFTPHYAETKFAVVVLALFGIVVVFSQVVLVADELLFAPLVTFLTDWLSRCYPSSVLEIQIGGGNVERLTVPKPLLAYYTEKLTPSIMLWLALQAVFAGLLVAAQPSLTFGDALYHMMITSTTVVRAHRSARTRDHRRTAAHSKRVSNRSIPRASRSSDAIVVWFRCPLFSHILPLEP